MPPRQRSDEVERAVLAMRVPADCRMVVAVSGGPDSITLLDALARTVHSGSRAWVLMIAHVNHELRGDESAEDERFVSALASSYGLPLVVRRVDTLRFAGARHLSPEAAARELRYAALRDAMTDWQGDVVCVAHTRDDQAETVLLRLARGAGLEGLAGMRARRGWLLRPLLAVSRASVRRYITWHGLQYRTDTSNADLSRARNRVRLDVLPAMESINPAAAGVIVRTADLLAEDADYLAHDVEDTLTPLDTRHGDNETSGSLPVWRALHPALRRRVLRRMVATAIGSLNDITADHVRVIEKALLEGSSRESVAGQLPHDIQAYVETQRFVVRRGAGSRPEPHEPTAVAMPAELATWNGRLVGQLLDGSGGHELDALLATCGPLHALCDFERTGPRVTVRSRRPGDRIALVGTAGTRKLQDVLVDRKVPLRLRDEVTVIENGEHIVWVPGFALDGRSAAVRDTRQVLHLTYYPVNSLRGDKMLGSF